MRAIVAEATEIQIDLHESEWAACVSETLIIQNLKPKWNVAGAFYFLYPLMAVGYVDGEMEFLYTTEPESINSEVASRLDFHGAFRSRFLCGRAFFSLMELLEFIGHKNKTRKFGKYTYLYSFRQIDESWKSDLNLFFRGESQDFFEKLILKLVESSSARRRPKEVQKCLNDLKSFWRHEACLLKRVRKFASEPKYPIPQKERDFLFIKYRYGATSIPIDGGWVAQ
jgi:excinuclease ABC subunit C